MRLYNDTVRVCKTCGAEFKLTPLHPGLATLCKDCCTKDVERCGAEVHWDNKHTVVVEVVKSLSKAQRFNRRGNRLGASVLRSIIPRPPSIFGKGDRPKREEHSNNPGASYTSTLGERHNTKR